MRLADTRRPDWQLGFLGGILRTAASMGGRRFSVGESYQRLTLMTRAGLEPATYGLKVRCSTS